MLKYLDVFPPAADGAKCPVCREGFILDEGVLYPWKFESEDGGFRIRYAVFCTPVCLLRMAHPQLCITGTC